MSVRLSLLSLPVAAALLFTTPAHASVIFTATLSGANETPPNASPAVGLGTFTLNNAQTDLQYSIVFSGLLGGLTAMHFHNAPPGIAGPVVRAIDITCCAGATSASLTGDWLSTDPSPLTAALVAQLLAGNIYVNVHSTVFPGGEIRGQLVQQIPEPSAAWLLCAGLAILAAFRFGRDILNLRSTNR